MSGHMTNVEIEDVLSSIRRLVSEDGRPALREQGAARGRPAAPQVPPSARTMPSGGGAAPGATPAADKLVLTPAFRVPDDATPAAAAPARGSDAAPAAPAAPGLPSDLASLEETIAELEAAVAARNDAWEPDGSERVVLDSAYQPFETDARAAWEPESGPMAGAVAGAAAGDDLAPEATRDAGAGADAALEAGTPPDAVFGDLMETPAAPADAAVASADQDSAEAPIHLDAEEADFATGPSGDAAGATVQPFVSARQARRAAAALAAEARAAEQGASDATTADGAATEAAQPVAPGAPAGDVTGAADAGATDAGMADSGIDHSGMDGGSAEDRSAEDAGALRAGQAEAEDHPLPAVSRPVPVRPAAVVLPFATGAAPADAAVPAEVAADVAAEAAEAAEAVAEVGATPPATAQPDAAAAGATTAPVAGATTAAVSAGGAANSSNGPDVDLAAQLARAETLRRLHLDDADEFAWMRRSPRRDVAAEGASAAAPAGGAPAVAEATATPAKAEQPVGEAAGEPAAAGTGAVEPEAASEAPAQPAEAAVPDVTEAAAAALMADAEPADAPAAQMPAAAAPVVADPVAAQGAVAAAGAAGPGDADGDAFSVFDEDDTVLDETALRELITTIIREELQGVLGERITRNVRKLVRAEIQRALASRDFE